MALRGDRSIEVDDCYSYTMADVAEKGCVVVVGTAGSGAVLGDSHGVVNLKVDPSGFKVAGILLSDYVSLDETRYHINWHKEQHATGDPAQLLKKGWVYTNKVSGTPTDGDVAYIGASGVVTTTNSGAVATPPVGVFKGKKDEDGYIKLEINIP